MKFFVWSTPVSVTPGAVTGLVVVVVTVSVIAPVNADGANVTAVAAILKYGCSIRLDGPVPRTLGLLDQGAFWANLGVSLLGFAGAFDYESGSDVWDEFIRLTRGRPCDMYGITSSRLQAGALDVAAG